MQQQRLLLWNYLVLSLLAVALAITTTIPSAAGQRLSPPANCTCVGQVNLTPDPRVVASNVALTMVTVYKSLQPQSPNGRQRFAILTAAMFDAYGVTSGDHPAASGVTVEGAEAVLPAEAVGTAAYAVMAAAYAAEPPKLARLHDLLRHHGFDRSALNGSVGARVAAAVMAKFEINPPAIPYTPLNPPSADANADCGAIVDADAWQPVCVQQEPGPPCSPQVIRFGALFNASLFSSGGTTTATEVVAALPPLPTYDGELRDLPFGRGENAFADEHLAILDGAAGLGDYEKAVVQIFGSSSSDRVARLAVIEAEARNLSLGASTALLYAVAAAIHDASASSTTAKYVTNAARPLSVLQCAYVGRNLTAWAGPYQGVATTVNAGISRWRPYWNTPGFPGFISGHTAVASAGLEAMAQAFGDDTPRSANCEMLEEGMSRVEPRVVVGARGWIANVTDVPNSGLATVGYSPAANTTVCWPTWRVLGELVGASRFYGGIHIPLDNSVGLDVGRDIGRRAWEYVHATVRRGGNGGAGE
ncbi:hypothetical protein MMPV_004532 [Pyropia vietnamensis]